MQPCEQQAKLRPHVEILAAWGRALEDLKAWIQLHTRAGQVAVAQGCKRVQTRVKEIRRWKTLYPSNRGTLQGCRIENFRVRGL